MKQVPLSKPISKFHDSNVLRKCGSETRKDYQNSYASLERKNQDIQPKSSTFHINRKLLQDLSNHIPVGVTLAWLKGGNATSVRLDEKYARESQKFNRPPRKICPGKVPAPQRLKARDTLVVPRLTKMKTDATDQAPLRDLHRDKGSTRSRGSEARQILATKMPTRREITKKMTNNTPASLKLEQNRESEDPENVNEAGANEMDKAGETKDAGTLRPENSRTEGMQGGGRAERRAQGE